MGMNCNSTTCSHMQRWFDSHYVSIGIFGGAVGATSKSTVLYGTCPATNPFKIDFFIIICRMCYCYLGGYSNFQTQMLVEIPSGERLHNYGKIHHAINGKIHYFDWAIFNSYVTNYQRDPEGISH